MANNQPLETRNTTFAELFSNGRRYVVPSFQRDYAWNIENWEDLWQDIWNVHQAQSIHFMGAIVTQPVSDPINTYDSISSVGKPRVSIKNTTVIIDGQQRLATLSILAMAIIDKIQQLADSNVDPEANKSRQEILCRTYLGDKDPKSLRYSSKLSLNENNNGFYQTNLINLRRPRYLTGFTQSEQLLWNAFEYFSEQLSMQDTLSRSGALLAELLTDTLAQRLLFIQITAEDQNIAFTLFETLNSRGIELGTVDLLKNYLFSLLLGPDDHYGGRQEWKKIVSTVSMEAFPAYLRCFLGMTKGRIKQQRLFKTIRENIANAEESYDLLTQLSSCSNIYVALHDSNDDFWKKYPKSPQVRKWIKCLNLFDIKQFDSVALAASHRFRDGKFEKLLKMAVILSFRYTISGLNLNELEKQCGRLAVAISEGTIKSPKAAFETISSLYVEDEKFQQDFSYLVIADSWKKGWIKYILQQLEKDISGLEVTEESFSIEHILPQAPDNDWIGSFGSKKPLSMVYRLGNVTLLDPAVNSALGRAPYWQKKVAFSKSAFGLTRNIRAEEWTPSAVADRQDRMAEQAVRIWQLNDYRQ